ncbi:unnamed protein product [marine sediment metagenome]|uniref:Uncharacterized protein n=1 Tax=marine sediment metagenome TaxID=412755 RepID=X1BZN1_9ZZZZ
MSNAVAKLYRIMLGGGVKSTESHYFDGTCFMIFLTHCKSIDDYWDEEDHETIILDCEGYW